MRFHSNNLKLWQKGLILAVVPVVFELVFIGYLVYLLREAERQIWLENKVKTIVVGSHELTKSFYDAGASIIFYGLTHNDAFEKKYDEQVQLIPGQVKQIKADVHELNPKDNSFDLVENDAYKGLDILRSIRARADLGDSRLFGRDVRKILQEFIDNISLFVDQFKQLEREAPEKAARSRSMVIYWLAVGVFVNIAIGIALAQFFNVGTARRLAVLMDNTKKLSRRQELNPPIEGEDELAHLDSVFRKMADELEEAAKRKQELVAMVSHDLRTPLMSIQVSLELLSAGAMGALPDQARTELGVAEYSATRLIHLINDLLDIDRMEAGKFDLSPRNCELGWILERCVHSVHAYAERSKVSVVVPDDDDDAQVYADPDRLAQVITNLLSNAIKFSPSGSEVVIAYEDLPDATVVKITDQGRGIPPGYEHKIFERFQQVNTQDAREKKGTGLGLAICKAIIDAHHGAIGVKSKEGKGSTFWFRVPKQRQDVALAKL